MGSYPDGYYRVVVEGVLFGDYPVQLLCPNCNNVIVTQIERKCGAFAWLSTAFAFVFCLPFFWAPACSDCTKDTYHTCPVCRVIVGVKRKL